MKVVTNNDDLWFRGFPESFVVRHEALSFFSSRYFSFYSFSLSLPLFVLPFFFPLFLDSRKTSQVMPWIIWNLYESCKWYSHWTLSSSVSAGHEEGHLQKPFAPNVVSKVKPESNVFQLFLVCFWRRGISEGTDLSPLLPLILQSNCSQSVRKLLPRGLLLSLTDHSAFVWKSEANKRKIKWCLWDKESRDSLETRMAFSLSSSSITFWRMSFEELLLCKQTAKLWLEAGKLTFGAEFAMLKISGKQKHNKRNQ